MSAITSIFSPSKPSAPVAAPPPPTQSDVGDTAAKNAAAAAASAAGRSATTTSAGGIDSALNGDNGTDQYSVRKKLLGA